MLKFSANLSLLFTELSFMDRFEAAKTCGFEAVEIQFPYELSAEAIQQQLEQHHLKLVLFNVDAGDLMLGGEGLAAVPEKKDDFKQAVKQAAHYAKILKPEMINVLAGRCFDDTKKSLYLETFKENLEYTLSILSPLGVNTVFEAINGYDMPHFIVDNSPQMRAIQLAINHPDLLMQYDIYHMHRMGETCAEMIRAYAPYMGHIQFADSPKRGQPDTGEINFKELFDAIEQSTYQHWLGAEYNPIGTTQESLGWYPPAKYKEK
ncbi:MAG: TIM barrel protein [Methylococcales bacterium]|nr:TIM barrel protein [Methylococcales bacterium]